MRTLVLIPLFLTFLLPAAQAAYTLSAVPDHAPWATSDVPRLAVRPGNCMTWNVTVTNDGQPAFGVTVSVTDADGRRSVHTTDSNGHVLVGTRTCWTTDHVADHSFQVTATFAGEPATSNEVVHEVMWSAGQVYADVPASGSGATDIPVRVVWSATKEPMDVPTARVTYGAAATDVALQAGAGTARVELDGKSQLTVTVPAEHWPSGGPGASVPVRGAGPFTIPAPGAPPPAGSSPPSSGSGSPPAPQQPTRQPLPADATPTDHEGIGVDGKGEETGSHSNTSSKAKGSPPPGLLSLALVLAVAVWSRAR